MRARKGLAATMLPATGPAPSEPNRRPGLRAGTRWRLVVLAITGAVGLVWIAYHGWLEVQSRLLLAEAQTAYQGGRWHAALRIALDQLALRPGDARGSLMAARALSRLHRSGEAEPYYREAGRLSLDDMHQRAFGLFLAQQTDQAAVVYEAILKRSPADATALRRLAAARIAQGQWAPALAAAQRLAALPGAEIDGQTLIATICYNSGQYPQAVTAFERVLALDPQLRRMPLNPPRMFWDELAASLLRLGRTADARRYLNEALAAGEDALLLDRLGQAYAKEGDSRQAERCWRRALELDSSQGDPWLNLGQLALKRNDPTEAVTCLTRAAELSPQSTEPLYALVQAYHRLGKEREADQMQRQLHRLRQSQPMQEQR